jgi:hypothetical protein
MDEADLTAAAVRMYTDADTVLALQQARKAEQEALAAAVRDDRLAIEALLADFAATTGPANGTVLAAEGGTFTISGTSRVVRFGAGAGWRTATLAPGDYTCQLSTFNSNSDPAEGEVKNCVVGPYTP